MGANRQKQGTNARKVGSTRRVGRPVRSESAEDVRRRLVGVARALFAKRGFGEVGIREIARAADVTPGMISYYFGDKQGLYEAMLASVFDELLVRVRELSAEPATGGGVLERLIRLYTATIAGQPWVPALLMREIVTGDSKVRARFVARFASRVAELLPALVQAEIGSGELRADLDPRLAVLSIFGMCVFPFLAHPVAGKVLGYELDAAFSERLIAHTTRLFFDGARPRPEER